MNRFEQTILAGIVRTIDFWRTATIRFPNDSRADHERWRAEKAEQDLALQETASVNLAAFLQVQPTASERTRASRAYAALEDAGLIERLTERFSERTSAIRLLPAGRSYVESLINQRDLPTATVPSGETDQGSPKGNQLTDGGTTYA